MCTNLLRDSRLFEFIEEIDHDSEIKCGAGPCPHCGAKLDRAFFKRKPRLVIGEFEEQFSVRPSFSCRKDGCRKRVTPVLLRFLGRKVYVSVIVVLVATMTAGPNPKRLSQIQREIGVPPRTVRRWLIFWRKIFTTTESWRYQRGHFIPAIHEALLPFSLLDRLRSMHDDCLQAFVILLRFTYP